MEQVRTLKAVSFRDFITYLPTNSLNRNQPLLPIVRHHPLIFLKQTKLLTHYFSAEEKIPFAMESSRYQALRVFGVLEIHLSNKYGVEDKPREYLVGAGAGKYSIADMGAWPWVKGWKFSGFSEQEMSKFPCLLEWIDRIGKRPAIKRAIGEKYDMPDGKLPPF
jgi:glutathione S-transferase